MSRVLWFTNTPSLYNSDINGYNGGGWISSLELLMSKQANIDLAICFFHKTDGQRVSKNNVTYYPLALYKSKIQKIRHNIFYEKYDQKEVKKFLKVIEDFKPDLIHIFGSEKSFGLITQQVKVPVIIHIQGILNPYLNAMFAPGTNKSDYIKFWGLSTGINKLKDYLFFSHNAKREVTILKNCKYFMGRTKWDKDVLKIYSPNSLYFYCSEILRPEFYKAAPWKRFPKEKLQLITTISKVDYKGFDLVLKTANLLKQFTNLNFCWKVFGIDSFTFWERKLSIFAKDVEVICAGIGTSEELIQEMYMSDIFIHTSYIDNSPNSICEAQLLGMPILSTNVGGITSLIEEGETGLLFASNDPYTLVAKIMELAADDLLVDRLSKKAREIASIRHDINSILNQNLSAYQNLLN